MSRLLFMLSVCDKLLTAEKWLKSSETNLGESANPLYVASSKNNNLFRFIVEWNLAQLQFALCSLFFGAHDSLTMNQF